MSSVKIFSLEGTSHPAHPALAKDHSKESRLPDDIPAFGSSDKQSHGIMFSVQALCDCQALIVLRNSPVC